MDAKVDAHSIASGQEFLAYRMPIWDCRKLHSKERLKFLTAEQPSLQDLR